MCVMCESEIILRCQPQSVNESPSENEIKTEKKSKENYINISGFVWLHLQVQGGYQNQVPNSHLTLVNSCSDIA